ncbi:MAG: hypothetical protein HKN92_08505, partial [Chitinophagales bacterium]|nr:hypothetical protein [Chitinophagales bacterium]
FGVQRSPVSASRLRESGGTQDRKAAIQRRERKRKKKRKRNKRKETQVRGVAQPG